MSKVESSSIPGGERVTIHGTGWNGNNSTDIDYIDGQATTITDHSPDGSSKSYEAEEHLGGLITSRGKEK